MTLSYSQEAKAKIIQELEEIYALSKSHNQFSQALRAKELIAKMNGFLSPQKTNTLPADIRVLSDEELDILVAKLKLERDSNSRKI